MPDGLYDILNILRKQNGLVSFAVFFSDPFLPILLSSNPAVIYPLMPGAH